MNKKFEKLLKKLKKLNLPDGKYAIYGSGPLAVRGIREAKDLDVIVTDDLYQKLKRKYFNDPKKERIKIGEIEIYPVWMWGEKFKGLEKSIKRAELIEGLRFVHLKDLLKWKVKMGRLKDFKDIKLIKNCLKIKMKKIYFASKNREKVATAKKILSEYGIDVIQLPVEFQEPRSDDPSQIAKEKVLSAWQKIKKPVITLDAGFFIPSLGGFPKAFVNFVLATIGTKGILKLVEGRKRDCYFQETLAFYDDSLREPLLYPTTIKGKLAKRERGKERDYFWSDLFFIFIPNGEKKTLAEMETEEYLLWNKNLQENSYLRKFAKDFLKISARS